jgi:hypothetical protein
VSVKRIILALSLAIAAIFPAQARLGEDEADTTTRYGPLLVAYNAGELGYPYRTLTFNHAGFVIITQFIGSGCDMVCFRKPNGEALAEDDIDLLLKSEAAGQKWSRSQLVSIDLLWDRPDGAMARYDVAKHALAFCSQRYIQTEDARRKAAQKRQLENL